LAAGCTRLTCRGFGLPASPSEGCVPQRRSS
jgi:hypothetical protein